jgi:hypothetical protein
MTQKSNPFSGVFGDWEPIDTPASKSLDFSDRPLSRPDRVALEHDALVDKYLGNNPHEREEAGKSDSSEHATFERRKKKGALDNDVNAKTFIVSGNKIIGSQG